MSQTNSRPSNPRGKVGGYALAVYVSAVIVAGLATLGLVVGLGTPVPARHLDTYLLLAAIVVFGELFPVTVTFRNERQDVTTSTSFAFAVLLIFGLAPALVAQAVASIASDIRQRKAWWKAAFNVAQYSLCWTVTAAVFTATAGNLHIERASDFTSSVAVAVIFAAVSFFVANTFFIATAISMAQRVPVLRNLAGNFVFYASVSAALFSLAPIVVVVAEQSIALVPLLFAPMIAVYKSAQISIEKQHQAAHDHLTDLANRPHLHERVQQAIDEHPDRALALLIVDLDHFKEVNDTLGHQVGDHLLCQVATRLEALAPPDATVARMGGDEFALLAPAESGSETAQALAGAVHEVLAIPFELEELTFVVGASIGAACYPEHAIDVDALVRKADVAMYAAKEQRGGFQMYTPDRDRRDARRLTLLADLRQGIDDGRLVLHYQPKADIRSRRVVGVEALVRWDHPEHGLLRPDSFIPLAEPTGLIGPLTMAVLDEALARRRSWADAGIDLRVAVNVSVRTLYDDQFALEVDRLLQHHGVPANQLTLEITESTMMADPTRPISTLSQLNMRGVQVAIDDFGTGYSSLAHLRRLPVTEIKIDKSFVMGMLDTADDATIVRSTIDLARNLGLTSVAEGVEDEETWRALSELGCHRAQGYLLSRPLPPDEFIRWLQRYEEIHAAGARHPSRTSGLRAV